MNRFSMKCCKNPTKGIQMEKVLKSCPFLNLLKCAKTMLRREKLSLALKRFRFKKFRTWEAKSMRKSTKDYPCSLSLCEELCTHSRLWDLTMKLMQRHVMCWIGRKSGTFAPFKWVGLRLWSSLPVFLSYSSAQLRFLGQTFQKYKNRSQGTSFLCSLSRFAKQSLFSSAIQRANLRRGTSTQLPFRWPSSNYTSLWSLCTRWFSKSCSSVSPTNMTALRSQRRRRMIKRPREPWPERKSNRERQTKSALTSLLMNRKNPTTWLPDYKITKKWILRLWRTSHPTKVLLCRR